MLPADAVTGVDEGTMAMLPPTYITVAELAHFTSIAEALDAAERRTITTVLPGVEIVDGEAFLTVDASVVP
jgi:hypothetical protein